MINLTTANSALKTVYLDVVDNLLNLNTNPLFAKIKKTTQGVYGKEIKVLAPYGINGGITAASETGELPQVAGNQYLNFTTELKNLYGRIEISDKAIRASQNSAGAFVNLLNDEMEGLIKSSSFSLSRMLYSDGRGLVAEAIAQGTDHVTYTMKNVGGLMEGMIVDIYDVAGELYVEEGRGLRILKIDRVKNSVTVDKPVTVLEMVESGGYYFVIQNSFGNELTGVEAIFNNTMKTLYGLTKANYSFLKGVTTTIDNDATFTEMDILKTIDIAEEQSGGKINFIATNSAVRRNYQSQLIANSRNIQTIDLGNGFKALDFYGIPYVSDKFVNSDTMYLLDTDAFTLHQMCDWEWMSDENGNVLTPKAGYPVYTATLVKYADLICSRPSGQAKIKNIVV